jgi:hydroxyethylthiazole kinase-like uncharacterized protein yjeF
VSIATGKALTLWYHKNMDKNAWRRLLSRPAESNKYDYGHVLVIGGSEAMTGAPVLAARAALRVGAGLVTIASSAQTIGLLDRDVEEPMTLSLPPWRDTEGVLETVEAFIRARHVSVLVVGPGLPRDARDAIRALLLGVRLPLIADAEAFAALSDHLALLRAASRANPSLILTPHPGEYARLLHGQATMPEKFAPAYRVTLVLKRRQTLVVSPTGDSYQNATGNPGLATAGAGDVLAGLIAGIAAQATEPFTAATMAVYLHGLAGDIAAKEKTEPGMIASDIIEAIPQALRLLA